MGDAVNKVVEVGTFGAVDDVTGMEAAQDAQKKASQALQANINRGLDMSEQRTGGILDAFNQGNQGAIADLLRARGNVQQGYGQGIDQLQSQAALFDPAASVLQQSATASGRAANINDILNDPNLAGVFDSVQDRTANQLSASGLRRSGAGAQMSNDALLNTALQFEADQYGRNQGLANIGSQGNMTIAQMLANQGGALANANQNLAAQRFAGGSGNANIMQQALANDLNLLGQLGQAQAAGITGPAMIEQQTNQGIMNLGAQAGAAMLSDKRAKENIRRVGSTDAGLGVYTYNYIGSPIVHMGVMAQEAAEMFPDAVITRNDGLLAVNYAGVS